LAEAVPINAGIEVFLPESKFGRGNRENSLHNIYRKLGVKNRTALAALRLSPGLD
jgi:hypothetical protein